jgi:type I restriction-modification system DNA methylase subunit
MNAGDFRDYMLSFLFLRYLDSSRAGGNRKRHQQGNSQTQ